MKTLKFMFLLPPAVKVRSIDVVGPGPADVDALN